MEKVKGKGGQHVIADASGAPFELGVGGAAEGAGELQWKLQPEKVKAL